MKLRYWKGWVFRELVTEEHAESLQCHHVSGGTILTVKANYNRTFDIKAKDFEALYITDPTEVLSVSCFHTAPQLTLHASCLMAYIRGNAFYAYMHRDAREFPAYLPYQTVDWSNVMDIIQRKTDSAGWREQARAQTEAENAVRLETMGRMMETLHTDSGAWADTPEKAEKRQRKRKPAPVGPALPCRRIIIKDRGDGDT